MGKTEQVASPRNPRPPGAAVFVQGFFVGVVGDYRTSRDSAKKSSTLGLSVGVRVFFASLYSYS